MNDITTATIDQQVQATLKDWRISPWKRANLALEMIEEHVRIEHGLTLDEFLPVPLEWEHRVGALTDEPRKIYVRPKMNALDSMTVIEGEVIEETIDLDQLADALDITPQDDDDLGLLKEAFHHLDDGEEAEAQEKMNKFWEWRK